MIPLSLASLVPLAVYRYDRAFILDLTHVYVGCIFPLAVYLLILANLNRGPQATLLSGAWDFAGVLFGVSGFVLFGGPAILKHLYIQSHEYALVDPVRLTTLDSLLRPLGQLPWAFWLSLWGLYYLGIAVSAAYLLWRRQDSLAIYNITSDDLALVLSPVLDRLKMASRQEGSRILLWRRGEENREAVVEQTAWRALRHITWRWRGEAPFRHELEAELGRTLSRFDAGKSPQSTWLLVLAGGLFVTVFFGLITYLFLLISR